MNVFAAVTDQDWFDYLSLRPDLDEVNFWTPKPWGGEFRVLNRGELLLFKLKSPYNAIAGGGFFEHYTELPVSLAWAAFGEKNGAGSYEAARERISRLRHEKPKPWDDYEIGSIVLVEPFFWPRERWIPQPRDWRSTIVRGKTYDLGTEIGRELWREILLRMEAHRPSGVADSWQNPEIPGGYGDPTAHPQRIGQGTFRIVVTDAYQRRCAVTRERALPVLDAAHIRPFSVEPRHYVSNGILLRSDVHRLFETGYVTVTPQYRAEVSRRIREDFDDGESYLKLHGTAIHLPSRQDWRPDPEILAWHNEHRFRG
ncbi:MAG: HNH endonuclease [Gammaproteobacteria bacterium]